MNSKRTVSNFLGAFADGAVLFPLLILLSQRGGLSASVLLASTGIAYFVSWYLFRVPMAVQPLKSIAVSVVAVGAQASEVRLSGAILGLFCILILFFKLDKWAARVPDSLVHGIQASLGAILIMQGIQSLNAEWSVWLWGSLLAMTLIVAGMLPAFSSWPLLGLVAALGLFVAWVFPFGNAVATQPVALNEGIRLSLVAALVLPQMALTMTNSVLGTFNVCSRYFGADAEKVTIRRLLQSIGWGNLLSALVGGLPFCHGAGGVTAHYRGGARDGWMNGVIGALLIGLSLLPIMGIPFVLSYPPFLLGALLLSIGFFHLLLATPTWKFSLNSKFQILAMILAAVITKNLLICLVVGIIFIPIMHRRTRDSLS